jgi:hypothetical protein
MGDAKKNGRYVFALSVFTNDSKYTDNSLITDRYSTPKSTATPGDTRNLNSYIASLDINYDFGNEEKLAYHFSYMNLAVNQNQSSIIPAKIANQKGLALNMDYRYPLTSDIVVNPIIEFVNLANVGGNIDRKANILTTAIDAFLYKNWIASLSNIKRSDLIQGANGLDTSTTELSFGYKFDPESLLQGFDIMAGYKRDTLDNKITPIKTDSIGVMVRYIKEF